MVLKAMGWVAQAALLAGAVAAGAQTRAQHKVVVISLDAFGAESLHDPMLPAPTLHAMMRDGAYARAMNPINPSVTWPNHTAMVTGVNASKHHLLVNGLIVDQRTDKAPSSVAHTPKSVLVAVPTVYDAAHAAGLTTAEVDWVAIEKADGITWRFTEYTEPHGEIEQDLVQQGTITEGELAHWHKGSQAWRDRMYTAAARDIIRKHHPDLLLVHLLSLDSIEHKTGWGNDSGINTIAFLDDRVKEIVDAVRDAGDLAHTTFLVVSDHGQMSVQKFVDPNDVLIKAGLQGPGVANPAFALNDGGFALVYQKHATPDSAAQLKKLFTGSEGIRSALLPEEAAKEGWPTPAQTDQAGDLLLYAANGFAFGPAREKNKGAHGYPNTEPLMKSIFIASGAGVAKRGEIPEFNNIDIAPTIARLLGIEMKNVDGKPVDAIFSGR
ncbi:alkaline phosphatase family protein [Granulicella cerasi]|uniref:Alkaline phosphatase family protein n=1 Tax=Granulicella cerasi TaxID=741063 RepID=A0ABW1ZCM5_9BACT|nr:alkaline phosphatase family protein [Granulicella cerasi]